MIKMLTMMMINMIMRVMMRVVMMRIVMMTVRCCDARTLMTKAGLKKTTKEAF